MRLSRLPYIAAAFAALAHTPVLRAQENYEIQVYPSATVGRNITMVELHSNYTLNGDPNRSPFGEFPTNHALHETVEITHGFTDNTELGFYWFMAKPTGGKFQWVGTHLRPRFSVPESWHWPVGVSISQEFGYAKSEFSADTWTYELRPIIDKQMGPWYVSLNPTLEKSLRGPGSSERFEFTPNVNVGYDVTKEVNLAVEYYGATGTITHVEPFAQQEHQLYAAMNLDVSPDWEINFGYGTALNNVGEKHIVKMILGRRFGAKHAEH